MLTYYFVRHGKKEAIPFDPPLTQLGIKQAEATSDYLKDIPFKGIFSSPKLRTKQTAEIISKSSSLPIMTDHRLTERLEWQNDESFDEFMKEWNKTDLNRKYQPKQGIASYANGERMKKFLDELSNEHQEGNVLIVTHGGTIGDLLRRLFTEDAIDHKTEPISGAKYIHILECSITTIRKQKDVYKLLKWGEVSHLSNI